MKQLFEIQVFLEEIYGAKTGLDVRDFVRAIPNLESLGQLVVDQSEKGVLDLALLLDRDILSSWEVSQPTPRALSVCFEETSHFVYLAFNHERGRNVTQLELETQSEVDRILLAFHSPHSQLSPEAPDILLRELNEVSYEATLAPRYEEARKFANRFLQKLSGGNPKAWSQTEFRLLREFFHSDLSEKIHLSRKASS